MTTLADEAAEFARGRFTAAQDGARWTLTLAGDWTTATLGALDDALRAAAPAAGTTEVAVDFSAVGAFDTAGAWLVYRTLRAPHDAGIEIRMQGLRPAIETLLATVAASATPGSAPQPPQNPFVAVVARTGRATIFALRESRDLVGFLGHCVVAIVRALAQPRRIRFTSLFHHIERAGLNAMPIVGLISFLIGIVMAFQSADQLQRFGASIFTVNIVGQGVLRELGVLLTAIMLAGRSGSAFTAQIGTMKVREEVDAMRTIGLDPMDVLVLPRLLALIVALPLLTFFADLMGLLGGALMAMLTLDITLFQFVRQLKGAVTLWTFWVGMIKAPVFGFVIALVGCYEGLRVTGSAESVGALTTRSVVESIFLVIVLDALFSIFFSVIGI
jgi:phospholipid/cholesterol/gamma-HCH transport system permease protein